MPSSSYVPCSSHPTSLSSPFHPSAAFNFLIRSSLQSCSANQTFIIFNMLPQKILAIYPRLLNSTSAFKPQLCMA